MKKVIAILMSCSLALAASASAQQEEQQQKPKKEKAQPERSHPANEARPAKRESVPQHAETKAPGHEKGPQSSESTYNPHTATKAPGKERANAGREQTEQRNNERTTTNESENAN